MAGNWLTQFKGSGGGLGFVPYQNARAAGYTPAQIAAALPGSGLTVGEKAQWQLQQDLAAMEQKASAADNYQNQANEYQSQLSGYQSQLDTYQRQLGDYSNQINSLTSQYQNALNQSNIFQQQATQWQTTAGEYGKQRDEWMTKAGDFESQFKQKSSEYEAARAEADRYREEAVGRQLAGLRGGATQTGGQNAAQTANIASGRTAYRPGSDDNMVKVEKNISATDSVLAKRGPVVQSIRTLSSGRPAAEPQGSPSAGTGSYYASRFSS